MGADITITKGLDLPMKGAPGEQVREVSVSGDLAVYPSEFQGVKFKMMAEEGDKVSRGGILARRKDIEGAYVRAPVAGTVKKIVLGDRRSLQKIEMEPSGGKEAEEFKSYTTSGLLIAKGENILSLLVETGLIGLVRQRPFSKTANPLDTPKSIFVNGMNTGPFRPDAHILVKGKEEFFQTGLNALTRLTDGPVHLNLDADNKDRNDALTNAEHVQVNYFDGPHPSGNTSTHIHYLDPIIPGDVVWTLRVSDVILIGELILTGTYPNTKRIMLAGEGVKEEYRGYVDVTLGTPLSRVVEGALVEEDSRLIRGDALCGNKVDPTESGVFLYDDGFVALPEDMERHLLGWYAPTKVQYSAHKVVPSNWLDNTLFSFGTSTRGSKRAMVLTGIYDDYVPLDIMVDPFSRACIAGETEDAIAHGILGTDPEDFALCTFVCPSKTDFGQIVANTLSTIEEEGF